MPIESFTNQHELVAELLGVAVKDLKIRDGARPLSWRRWVARDRMVTASLRPDNRWFLSFVGPNTAAYPELAYVAAEELDAAVHCNAAADSDLADALMRGGFEIEVKSEKFRIRFDRALDSLHRAWVPSGYEIKPAADVEHDKLFALDNQLRDDVPGTDGWQGNRTMFDDELDDPAAYPVAVHQTSGDYAGMARIWNNPSDANFGLIGVARSYRDTPVAAALLKESLTIASAWGKAAFTAHTSLSNTVIYPKLERLGAHSLGRFVQLVRHP